jgi:hypothetical protein
VNFYDGTAHTITLATTSALPTVTDNLTITGPGSGVLTINRTSGAFQILPISNASGVIAVNLSGMTVSGAVNATNGGAISDTNAAALTLTDVTIQNNSTSVLGGGIYVATAGTAVTLTNSTLQANTSGTTTGGGAIYFSSSGGLTMTGSSMLANRSAGSGAGVYVGTGTNTYFTITQSTIANNSAATNGGGLRLPSGTSLQIDRSTLSGNTANSGQGGGVYFAGTVGGGGFKVVNTTIANNMVAGATSSGGGIAFTGSMLGLANIVSSTITGNSAGSTSTTYGTGGGGIALITASTVTGAYSTIAMDNSIISGNSASAANGRPDISATNAASTNVSITDYYCAIGSTAGYSQISLGGSLPVGTPLNMGVLSGNGGPTQTIPLDVGSPAIDAGDPAQGGPGFTDQRGVARPQGAAPDIGAFERIPGIPTAGAPAGGYTNVTDLNAATSNPYQFTVTYADQTAMKYSTINNNSNAVTVTTPTGVSPVTVTFVSATPTNNAPTITATYQFTVAGGWNPADNGTYTVSMAANQVQNTSNVYVQPGVLGTFTVAMAYTGANALVVTGTGDTGTGSGLAGDLRYVLAKAATAVGTSTPNVINFSNSTAGGATNFYDGAQHTIAVGTALPDIPDNVTITGPGASVLTVSRSASATGAFKMFNLSGPTAETVTINGMTIAGASGSVGGAFGMVDQTLTLTNMTLTGNTALDGACVAVSGAGTINISNSSVSANSASAGAGIYVNGGAATITIVNSTLSNNTGSGSVIYSTGHSTIGVSDSTIANNRGSIGGAMDLFSQNPNLSITNSTITGNSASTAGAIYISGSGVIAISNSTIVKNTGTTAGAIDAVNIGTGLTLTSVTMMNNTATTGGAVNFSSGAGGITIDNSIIVANTAATGPNINAGSGLTVNSSYDAIDNINGFSYFPGTGDLSQADSTPVALHLQPLASQTGPNGTFQMVTFTAGSTAIDAGDSTLGGTTDQLGTARPQGAGVDIGAYEWVPGIPSASPPAAGFTPVNDANAASSNPYQFTVVYQDYTAMNYSTINGNNNAITVTTPAGVAPVTVSFVSATPASNAATITATYQFTMPGGWVTADNGLYTVTMNANQVYNTTNHAVPAGPIGAIQVGLSYSGANALVVSNTGDTGAGSGLTGDLRYVLTMSAFATGNASPNQINFSNTTAGGATNFYDGSQHTIVLGSALPVIPDNVTMSGPGANVLTVTRGAAPAFQIFTINGPTAQSVTFGGMTVTGGNATLGGALGLVDQTVTLNGMTLTGNFASDGAAVYVAGAGTVNVNNSTINSNSAGAGGGFYMPASSAGATLNISNSTLNGNTGSGAVVYAPSHVSININNSTLNNNRSGIGGVIDAFSQNPNLSITNSTLSGNSASTAGAIYINGSGTIVISDSTFAHNTASTAGAIDAVNIVTGLTLTSVTMVGNTATTGGAINYSSGAGGLTIDNSIIAGNTAATGPNINAGSALTVGVAYSAIDNTSGFSLTDNGGNLSAANSTTTALKLGPLQFNYGGTTQTYGLLLGSTAVDVGDSNLAGTTDQNGTSRPQGSGVDIGSVERIPGIPAASPPAGGFTNVTDANAATSNPYQFTVVYTDDTAINHLTIDSSDVSVVTPAGVAPVTVSLVSGSITPNADAQTVSATYQFTVPGGWSTADDGTYTVMMNANQVYNTGYATNHAVPPGLIGTFNVALAYTGANALVVTSTGDTGSGSGLGGDLRYVLTKAAQVVGSSQPNQIVFSNSTAGGATNFYDGAQHTITLNSSLPAVPENVVIAGPGANVLTITRGSAVGLQIFNVNGPTAQTVTINNVTLTGGGSITSGGAINMVDQTLTLNGVTLTGCSATSTGACVAATGAATITVNNCTITANSAADGAGFYLPASPGGATLNIANSTLSNNTGAGSVVYAPSHATINITNSTLSHNSGSIGGAMDLFSQNPNLSITNSTISGNTASTAGAIYISGSGVIAVTNSTIANNSGGTGGAIDAINIGTGITLTSVTMTGNSATTGGAISFTSGTAGITIDNSILAGNVATTGPNINSPSGSIGAAYSAIDNLTGFNLTNNGNNLSVANSSPAALALQPLANATGPNGTFAVIGLGAGSTAIDHGDPALGGSGQTDEIGTPRPQGAGVDIGAVEKVVAPPHILSVQVGDASGDRSEVRSILVTFDTAVNFTGGNSNAAAAFQLLHTQYDTTVYNTQVANLQTAVTTNGSGQTVVTITFTTTGNAATEVDPQSVQSTAGGPTTPSLGDGQFTLTVLAANVSGPGGALAGNGTTAGTNYVSSSTSGPNGYGDIFRLFGDSNGDGLDDLTDLTAFRNTYNSALGNASYRNYMDADNDGVIDLDDLTAFRNHYNHHV